MARNHSLDRSGHGGAIRDPAAAERQRQLGQSGAAHPAALLFQRRSDMTGLRAGMSADVSIDTGRTRSLAGL